MSESTVTALCGLSAPKGRTVRRSKTKRLREGNVSGHDRKIGADRPHHRGRLSAPHFVHTPEPLLLLSKAKLEVQTVRPKGPDRPPLIPFTQHRTTTFLSRVEKSGADRPPSSAGPSAIVSFCTTQKQKFLSRSCQRGADRPPLAVNSRFFKFSHRFLKTSLALMHATSV